MSTGIQPLYNRQRMRIEELNKLDIPSLREALWRCNGAAAWIDGMVRLFPMSDKDALMEAATRVWYSCTEADWREAFAHHPKIGDLGSLKKKFSETGQLATGPATPEEWAAGEQSGVRAAPEDILIALAAGNDAYEQKFGYIFIVYATGKSAGEMLDLLRTRLENDPDTEIHIAMGEQDKITRIRLEKLLT